VTRVAHAADEVPLGAGCHGHATAIIDLDIWRTANLLVKRHGLDGAIRPARGRTLGCRQCGRPAIWKRIVEATLELLLPNIATMSRSIRRRQIPAGAD
jgi:hypothetical protein